MVTVSSQDTHFTITWTSDSSSPSSFVFHHVWLRDNCHCVNCRHPTSLQMLRSSAKIPISVKPTSHELLNRDETLKITWNDQHASEYDVAWLRAHAYHNAALDERREQVKPKLWEAVEIGESHSITFHTFMNDDKALKRALRVFLDYGILFIQDVPKQVESVELVATRVGPIRETFFGRSWDVINIPKATNIAYTSVDLGLHQDLPYFESVPPVQLLHCLTASQTGGESIFVDSYLAAERFRKNQPEHFKTLMRVPMTFQYLNSGHNFFCQKPILYSNHNLYVGVNFSPQNHGPLKVPPSDIIPFYEAFKLLSDEIYNEDLTLTRKLKEGELVMFDNRRVLHARSGFPNSEPRHLRGTYMGMDEVEDKYHGLVNKST